MPTALNRLCWLCWILAGLAIAVAIHAADGPRVGFLAACIYAQILLFPVSVTLGAGYSERQTWTRPLMIGLLAVVSAVLARGGLYVIAIPSLVATIGIAFYLYRAAAPRRYYAHLREEAIVRITLADLGSWIFVPLYTAGVGIILGIALGWWLVSRHLAEHPTAGPMGPNEIYAIVLTSVVCAAIFGTLGKFFGEALVSRFGGAA